MRAVLAHDFAERAAPAAMPERMDRETDYQTFRDTVASLASVNRLTMGYRPQRIFLDHILSGRMPTGYPAAPLRVLDVGSGYGDGVRFAARHLARQGAFAAVTGVDLNPSAARASRGATEEGFARVEIEYVEANVFDYARSEPPPHVIVSALFTHHLEDDDVVRFLRWMDETATVGWLINDLWRWKPAAIGFGALATVLGKHPYVRHDGPVSFARSFKRRDWKRLLTEAGVEGASVRMMAPFRLCVTKLG